MMFTRRLFGVNRARKALEKENAAARGSLTRRRSRKNDSLKVRVGGRDLRRNLHARDLGDVAMRFAAHIVLETDFVAQIVEEANLEFAGVVHRVTDRRHVLELSRADLAPALGDFQRV